MAKHAPEAKTQIALSAGAPYGAISVNKDRCTLCKACIGACPEAALLDSPDAPRLRFIEANCVQCGLCASTCPEDAIQLVPRLTIGAQAKEPVTLNEAEPCNCVRCGKAYGTKQLVDNMLGKLAGHSMYAGAGALRRLQMCADCRVIDMMENKQEASIFDVRNRASRSSPSRPRNRRGRISTACWRGFSTRRRTRRSLRRSPWRTSSRRRMKRSPPAGAG